MASLELDSKKVAILQKHKITIHFKEKGITHLHNQVEGEVYPPKRQTERVTSRLCNVCCNVTKGFIITSLADKPDITV